ncbi:hypothetical protein MTO96_028326 [Rhipicephalus appendiculatus]
MRGAVRRSSGTKLRASASARASLRCGRPTRVPRAASGGWNGRGWKNDRHRATGSDADPPLPPRARVRGERASRPLGPGMRLAAP